MESKSYELLEKLYGEMQEVKREVKEMKSTMVTKTELEEIKSTMATKAELEEIRTTMATKTDLEEIRATMATKEDLNILSEELHTEIQSVYDEVKELRHDLNKMEIMTTKNAYELAILKAAR